mgnify:CR=1 FL=1
MFSIVSNFCSFVAGVFMMSEGARKDDLRASSSAKICALLRGKQARKNVYEKKIMKEGFTWTDDFHIIFLIALIEGKVCIDNDLHPIFRNKQTWIDFTERFRNLMIENDLYSPDRKLLFERPDKGYINGKQILQSHYSDIKKQTASYKSKQQAKHTHEVMKYMNRCHVQ